MPKQSARLSPLDLQALPEFEEDAYMQSPSVLTASHAGLHSHSPALKNPLTGALQSPMGPTCNFADFSRHFHLPLKSAAEKFGVRATAFKKRCRAIGIRHWPYRKVRSLKRSLQELSRSQEQTAMDASGGLSDKQQRQLAAYQAQLNTLLSPETYGIDPSGRLNVPAPFDDGENDMDDDDDDVDSDSPYSSPRACFAEPESRNNALHVAESQREFLMAMANAPSHLRTFRRQTAYHSSQIPPQLSAAAYSAFYSGQAAANMSSGASSKIVFGWPDSYYFNEDLMGAMDTLAGPKAKSPNGSEDQTSAALISPEATNTASNDFLATDLRFEEVRQLREGYHDGFPEPSGLIDYSSERFFDDVFLQISPDYGCLV